MCSTRNLDLTTIVDVSRLISSFLSKFSLLEKPSNRRIPLTLLQGARAQLTNPNPTKIDISLTDTNETVTLSIGEKIIVMEEQNEADLRRTMERARNQN